MAARHEVIDDIVDPAPNWEALSAQVIATMQPEIARNPALWIVVKSLNNLGVLHCQRGSYVQAVLSLHIAEHLYILQSEFTDCIELQPEPLDKLLYSTPSAKSEIHTYTLFFLAQVYGYLNNSAQAAK